MKLRNVAVVTSILVALGVFTACSAQADPGVKTGTPQNPCYGTEADCVEAGWYITRVKVGDRQVTCVSQDYYGSGVAMSCDWPQP